jgi:NAD(P)-dependent dehydrogenase (short-subunit alcohol dehydrogenase family)
MTDTKRVVLITGAAGGIGRACIDLFTRNGWRVIGVDMIDFGAGFPADGLFIKADISQANEMERIYQQAAKFSTMLHAVVNVAAYQVAKPLIKTTLEEWQQVMDTNLRPVFLSAKLGFDLMKAAGEGQL